MLSSCALVAIACGSTGELHGQSTNGQHSWNPPSHVIFGGASEATPSSPGSFSAAEREQLRQRLATSAPAEQRRRLYDLTFEPRRELRVFALTFLNNVEPDEPLRNRIVSLSQSDADPVVRGHARLLASDWNDRNSSRQEFSNQYNSQRGFARPAIRQPNNARLPTPKRLPPLMTDQLFSPPRHDLSRGSLSRGPLSRGPSHAPFVSWASAVGVADEGTSNARAVYTPEDSPFAPVTPFWENPSGSTDGLPVDAGAQHLPRFLPASSSVSQPGVLQRPLEIPFGQDSRRQTDWDNTLFVQPFDAPLGFTGPSGILPTEIQENAHFVPVEDRWRLGFPDWDRYDRGFPRGDDYPYQMGRLLDPYNQNVLKGDYPVIGQHTFLNITAISFADMEYRQVPTATTPFESTEDPFSEPFFGNPNQFFYSHYFRLAIELFHGSAGFKQFDWRVLVEPVFNVNYLHTNELAVVNPDVRHGTDRTRTDFALEQWFVEAKLADLSPDYDFLSIRAGSQLFVSDFRGFLFKDINRGVRLFGTRFANRDQFNLVWFDQAEKETNSELNTFDDRHQNVVIANYFRQDFIVPGYTGLLSFHYNLDKPSFKFDENDVLVRPDPSGIYREHEVNAYYIGLGGDGHIGRINITNQFYLAFGKDSDNPIANCNQDIFAGMAAVEVSYDRDWIRFRSSYFFASGDDDPNDKHAGGFDTILDDPIFAGGEFSYWQRQAVRLFGVNLTQRKSLVPNLRSSKIEGQSNFVNPGLHLFNLGADIEVTPKVKIIANANYMFFDNVAVLKTFTFQENIGRDIGTDLSIGVEWRPCLNDNIIIAAGSAILIPASGLRDLFGSEVPADVAALTGMEDEIPKLQSHFLEVILMY